MGIFCLAELYVHINEYEIERDAQVIKSDLFYYFSLAHAFEVFLLSTWAMSKNGLRYKYLIPDTF